MRGRSDKAPNAPVSTGPCLNPIAWKEKLATYGTGILGALQRLTVGQAMTAGVPIAEDGNDRGNQATVPAKLFGQPLSWIEWARRSQGLVVRAAILADHKGIGMQLERF
jgi:hypothetical protein